MQFGDYLKQRRGERGWTQPEVAARADIETKDLAGLLFPAEFDRLREDRRGP